MSSLRVYNARMPQGLNPTRNVEWQLDVIREIAVQKHGQTIADTLPYDFIFTYLTAGRRVCETTRSYVCVERRGRLESLGDLHEYLMGYMRHIEGSEVVEPRVMVRHVI